MLLFIFMLVAVTIEISGVPTDLSPDLQIVNANSEFANEFYNAVKNEEQGNILISPLSAHACLSMLYQGTGGATKEACARTLRIQEPSIAAEGYNKIIGHFNNNVTKNVAINIANKMFVKKSLQLKKNFENSVTQNFQSEVGSVDFSDKEAAAKYINDWVNEKTRGKIPKLYKADEIDEDILVLLVNAVYFKGRWAEEFSPSDTKTEDFYSDEDNTVAAQMMYNSFEGVIYKESRDLDAKIIELPFRDHSFSMIFILPNQRNGLTDLESKMTTSDINSVLEGATFNAVKVSLPKFKFSKTIQLKEILKALGLGILFEDSCDLSELSDVPSKVSKGIQKTFIQVDEEGCEAAAATAIEGVNYSLTIVDEWKEFKADHPFLFILAHKNDNKARNNLFYGRIKKPEF